MTVLLGYGYHGITCGACGCANVAVEDHPDVDGIPALFLRCWNGCTALRPRSEYPNVPTAPTPGDESGAEG
jgi:hypothetical protein